MLDERNMTMYYWNWTACSTDNGCILLNWVTMTWRVLADPWGC